MEGLSVSFAVQRASEWLQRLDKARIREDYRVDEDGGLKLSPRFMDLPIS
jgi:hypothetical protein